jgi:hypothetical protein
MRFPEKFCDIALAMTILLTGCGGSKQTAEASKTESAPTPAPAPEYAPPEGTFVIKARKPEIRSYGTMTEYTFHGADVHGFPLLKVDVIVFGAPGSGAPGAVSLDQYERAFAAEPGAVVTSKDLAQGAYTGRELTVTRQGSQLMVRIYTVNGRTYMLQWNPSVAHSTETADTFEIP